MTTNLYDTTSATFHRRYRLLATVIFLLATLTMVSSAIAQNNTGVILTAQRASVFLTQTYDVAGSQTLSCVGSGTLISATGLILTNAHLAGASGPCRGERIVVALPVRLDEPPVPTYVAEVVQSDPQLDLAILQITGALDGSLIDPQTLNLPFVSIGDSSRLLPGNSLTFVGYPDIGSTSVTSIEGLITSITTEKTGSRLAWFRTDTALGGGMSGGGAYDSNGLLVGIPTSAPATAGTEAGPMCLSIQDNTRDGVINDRDACVPIGGPVTAIRPIFFALPLIESAKNGFILRHASGIPSIIPSAPPTFTRPFFSTGVSDFGVPTRIVSALPSGVSSLFFFFDYDNMQTGIPYEVRVTKDGLDMPQFSLGPLAWGGGRKGTWYVGTENVIWPDGNYEFILLLNGQPVAASSISIGGISSEPVFSNLTFGIPSSSGDFLSTGTLLPALVTQLDARFSFEGMQDGQDWTEVWYLDGTEVFRMTRLWDQGESGQATVSAINYQGLPLGTYRLELYIGQRLAATGDVTLAGNRSPQEESLIFSNPCMVSDITRDGLPATQCSSVMPLGISSLYAFVDWDLIPNGIPWTYRWFLDGRLVAASTQLWDAGGVGQRFWVSLSANKPLPEGSYAVEVVVGNRPMFSLNATIGSGTQPISGIPEEANEVRISGTVVDALTGEGIPGALIAVLDVALESPQFTWNESEIMTQAITDREGRFVLPRGLTRGNYYTVYVFAEGYTTIVEDNFTVFRNQPSPADIVIEMRHP
jgi:hypothetical protein